MSAFFPWPVFPVCLVGPVCHRPLPDLTQTTARSVTDHCPVCHRPLPHLSQTTAPPVTDHCPACHRPLPGLSQTTARPVTDHCWPVTDHYPACHQTVVTRGPVRGVTRTVRQVCSVSSCPPVGGAGDVQRQCVSSASRAVPIDGGPSLRDVGHCPDEVAMRDVAFTAYPRALFIRLCGERYARLMDSRDAFGAEMVGMHCGGILLLSAWKVLFEQRYL